VASVTEIVSGGHITSISWALT